MRVTDRLMFERSSRDLGRARSALDAARDAVTTGRRVSHPGDDPAAAGAVAALGISSRRAEAVARSAEAAVGELDAADAALGTVSNALARAQELAVQFSNGTYTADQRAAGALEVEALFGTAVAALNARHANRYVFGGFADGAAPFDAAGTYLGGGVRQLELAPGVLQATSVRADVAIKGAGGGVDVLATLAALRTALATNDAAAIRGSLGDLDRSVTQVSTGRAEVGVMMSALDAASAAGRLAADAEKAALARLSETDLVDGAIRLAQAQHALEAAMAATSKSLELSLLDHLR